SKNPIKEMTNRLKELEMLEALNSWQQISPDQLKLNLQKVQNRIINQWRVEAELQRIIQSNLADPQTIDGKVSCRSCDHYLGQLSWLRKRRKVRCGNRKCREDIGGAQQFTDRPDILEICALTCKKLKFSFKDLYGNYHISTFKKWTDVRFKILELEPPMSTNTVPVQQ
ncbi:unnamed protein product, partial [Rotaria sp. Silwood1]